MQCPKQSIFGSASSNREIILSNRKQSFCYDRNSNTALDKGSFSERESIIFTVDKGSLSERKKLQGNNYLRIVSMF
jgi:hypothetical protein